MNHNRDTNYTSKSHFVIHIQNRNNLFLFKYDCS